MNGTAKEPVNHGMETMIGNLLRAGVIVSAAVVFSGGLIYLFRHGSAVASYKVFQRVPLDLCSVQGILKNCLELHGRGLIQLGLLLLIATPIARVALSIFAFARKRDYLYVLTTLIVLCILIFSILKRA
jgi:uncharacterized membrane protein